VICDPTKMSKRELEALTRRYVAEIIDAIGPKRTSRARRQHQRQIMAWVMDTYSMHVGTPRRRSSPASRSRCGGSLGRREATGRGVMIAARESAKHLGSTSRARRSRFRVRQRRLGLADLLAANPARDRRRHRLEGRRAQRQRPRHPKLSNTSASTRPSPVPRRPNR
jgi:hypothetical protein